MRNLPVCGELWNKKFSINYQALQNYDFSRVGITGTAADGRRQKEAAMAKDILHTIQENMAGFSKGQKRIAAYILSDYDKAAFMTASRLGGLVDVSESTVVRFASMLGYSGYPAMQKALQEMVRSKLTSIQRIRASNDRLFSSDVVASVLHSDKIGRASCRERV